MFIIVTAHGKYGREKTKKRDSKPKEKLQKCQKSVSHFDDLFWPITTAIRSQNNKIVSTSTETGCIDTIGHFLGIPQERKKCIDNYFK